jgi:hypothetical protein
MSGIPFVGIAARTYDPVGSIMVPSPSTPKELPFTRRVTRTPTLDGLCAVYDGGATATDSIVKIAVKSVSSAMASTVRHIVELHARVTITLPSGCYEAAPESVEVNGADLQATFLIVGVLSA